MKKIFLSLIVVLQIILFFWVPQLFAEIAHPGKTEDYYKCFNRSGGVWAFGRGPIVCDAETFIEESYIKTNYPHLIFDDSKNETLERKRYMKEMHIVLKDIAKYFLSIRKPSADQEELAAFTHAVFSIANQESFWSHYRIPVNGRLQFMRGDFGHGHGIMQVDDRYHFNAVVDGRGANLVHNILYSLDEYFYAWELAPDSGCVENARDFKTRARAAYSAYNGGLTKICRFTNPNDRWARNDVNFLEKWTKRNWEFFVEKNTTLNKINFNCIVDGHLDCFIGNSTK